MDRRAPSLLLLAIQDIIVSLCPQGIASSAAFFVMVDRDVVHTKKSEWIGPRSVFAWHARPYTTRTPMDPRCGIDLTNLELQTIDTRSDSRSLVCFLPAAQNKLKQMRCLPTRLNIMEPSFHTPLYYGSRCLEQAILFYIRPKQQTAASSGRTPEES